MGVLDAYKCAVCMYVNHCISGNQMIRYGAVDVSLLICASLVVSNELVEIGRTMVRV